VTRIASVQDVDAVAVLPTDTVAIVVLLRRDGAALMQHRDNKHGLRHPNQWVMPGGHCEDGESFESCARREFFEETGYRLDHLEQLVKFIEPPAELPANLVTVFWALYDDVQPVQCHEGQALAFIERERAAN
jgi:8-oxo-dGTP diphosphatase